MTLTVNDRGMKRLAGALDEIGKAKVLIGWQGAKGAEKHPNSDLTNAEVATMMEVGTSKMPARPAIAQSEATNRNALIELMQSLCPGLVDGTLVPGDVLERIGESGLNALRVAIEDAPQWAAALAESTIKAKGGLDTPWIDSGTLYETSEVVIQRGTGAGMGGVLPGAIGGSG